MSVFDPLQTEARDDILILKAENGVIVPNLFDRFTTGCARFAGRPAMVAICLLLAAAGVIAYFSGNELFISGANLAISVVTLLLLPILQATQNRDGAALQAKIDELIKASGKARDDLIGLENRAEDEIEQIRVNEGQRAKATGKRRTVR
jgi:low affinity Fe/Cu permease